MYTCIRSVLIGKPSVHLGKKYLFSAQTRIPVPDISMCMQQFQVRQAFHFFKDVAEYSHVNCLKGKYVNLQTHSHENLRTTQKEGKFSVFKLASSFI